MSTQNKVTNNLKFKYIYDPSFNPVYTNGMQASLTPKGELTVNFYFERAPLPKTQTYAITSEGTMGDKISSEPNDGNDTVAIVRYIESGIILDLESAKALRTLLDNHIKMMEERQPKQG